MVMWSFRSRELRGKQYQTSLHRPTLCSGFIRKTVKNIQITRCQCVSQTREHFTLHPQTPTWETLQGTRQSNHTYRCWWPRQCHRTLFSLNNTKVLTREPQWTKRKVKEVIHKDDALSMIREQRYQLPQIYHQLLLPGQFARMKTSRDQDVWMKKAENRKLFRNTVQSEYNFLNVFTWTNKLSESFDVCKFFLAAWIEFYLGENRVLWIGLNKDVNIKTRGERVKAKKPLGYIVGGVCADGWSRCEEECKSWEQRHKDGTRWRVKTEGTYQGNLNDMFWVNNHCMSFLAYCWSYLILPYLTWGHVISVVSDSGRLSLASFHMSTFLTWSFLLLTLAHHIIASILTPNNVKTYIRKFVIGSMLASPQMSSFLTRSFLVLVWDQWRCWDVHMSASPLVSYQFMFKNISRRLSLVRCWLLSRCLHSWRGPSLYWLSHISSSLLVSYR